MNHPAPIPYRVAYSERVRQWVVVLARHARERGDAPEFLTALKELDRRLHVYPQFGEQVYDLLHEAGQSWIGFVRPLSMRYGVYDGRRLVFVGALPVLLPKSKPDAGG